MCLEVDTAWSFKSSGVGRPKQTLRKQWINDLDQRWVAFLALNLRRFAFFWIKIWRPNLTIIKTNVGFRFWQGICVVLPSFGSRFDGRICEVFGKLWSEFLGDLAPYCPGNSLVLHWFATCPSWTKGSALKKQPKWHFKSSSGSLEL